MEERYFKELVHFASLASEFVDVVVLLLDLALSNFTHEGEILNGSL